MDPTLYKQLMGSLMYLVNTRLDICFVVNSLSQFMVEPKCVPQIATKHVLRYLQGIVDYGLKYVQQYVVKLEVFTDVDWVGSIADKKSTSRCSFSLGSRTVSWYNMKRKTIAQIFAEVEYMAASMTRCDAIWLYKLLARLFDQKLDHTVIQCDNQSCIKLYENPLFHDKSKRNEIKDHFI